MAFVPVIGLCSKKVQVEPEAVELLDIVVGQEKTLNKVLAELIDSIGTRLALDGSNSQSVARDTVTALFLGRRGV